MVCSLCYINGTLHLQEGSKYLMFWNIWHFDIQDRTGLYIEADLTGYFCQVIFGLKVNYDYGVLNIKLDAVGCGA